MPGVDLRRLVTVACVIELVCMGLTVNWGARVSLTNMMWIGKMYMSRGGCIDTSRVSWWEPLDGWALLRIFMAERGLLMQSW